MAAVAMAVMMALGDVHAAEDRNLYWRDYGGIFSA